MKINIPKTCKKCNCCATYDSGYYSRNPHCCCELMYVLFEEDYKVDPNKLDSNCPKLKLKDIDFELRRE